MYPSKALPRYGTGNHNGLRTRTTIPDVAIGLFARNECSRSEEMSNLAASPAPSYLKLAQRLVRLDWDQQYSHPGLACRMMIHHVRAKFFSEQTLMALVLRRDVDRNRAIPMSLTPLITSRHARRTQIKNSVFVERESRRAKHTDRYPFLLHVCF